MSDWLNMVTINVARNGTTSHTVNPASTGTVVAGVAFTPTAGRLLVAVVEGAVTSTTPSGWTLPTGGSAVNNTGLYVWYRTAAGSDTISTTHNGSNYPMVVTFFEFAAGSTFVKSVAATTTTLAGANPALTGLTGTNWLAGVKAVGLGSGDTYTSTAWSGTPTPTKIVDTTVAFATTDGYGFSVAEVNASTATSFTPTGAVTNSRTVTCESLTFAVNVASGGSSVLPVTGTVAAVSAAVLTAASRSVVSGATAGVSTAAVSATSRLVVAGIAAAASATVASPTALLPVSGAVAATSNTSGSLGSGVTSVSGTVAASSTVTAAVTGRLAASGRVDAVTAAVGALAVVQPISGAVAAVAAGAGAVTLIPGDSLTVTGNVAAVSTAAGSVQAILSTVGHVAATTTASLSAGARLGVVAALTLRTDATGAVQVTRTAVGTIAAVSAVSGAVSNPSNDRDITVTASGPYRHPFTVTSVHGSTITVGSPSRNPLNVSGATR